MSNIMLVLTCGVVEQVLFFAVFNHAIQFIGKVLVMPSLDSPGEYTPPCRPGIFCFSLPGQGPPAR